MKKEKAGDKSVIEAKTPAKGEEVKSAAKTPAKGEEAKSAANTPAKTPKKTIKGGIQVEELKVGVGSTRNVL